MNHRNLATVQSHEPLSDPLEEFIPVRIGDDYRYRFESETRQRFMDLLRERFNSVVWYDERAFKWDTMIEQKAIELGRFIAKKSSTIGFAPSPDLAGRNDRELRCRILALTQSKARELGFGKSTLHYLRANAKSSHTFTVSSKVRKKLTHARLIRRL